MDGARVGTLVIGGGQAGLAMGYHLAGRSFLILDAHERIGDSWRQRWDSLRLFTPARYDALPGQPFPAPAWSFPTHDEFADYLTGYALRRRLPVRTGTTVHRLWHNGTRYVADTATGPVEATRVVLATGRAPWVPEFAGRLDAGVTQLHAADYRNPSALPPGAVLVVGAGNSGATIALELATAGRRTLLSGRHPGHLPCRIDGPTARTLAPIVLVTYRHLLTVRTPPGRALRAHLAAHSGPLIRLHASDLAAVHRVPRTVGVRDGQPLLADGSTAAVSVVVWCTGYRPDTSWIDLPGFGPGTEPPHRRGVVTAQPGLHLLGRPFQYSAASSLIAGVAHDAAYLAAHLDP